MQWSDICKLLRIFLHSSLLAHSSSFLHHLLIWYSVPRSLSAYFSAIIRVMSVVCLLFTVVVFSSISYRWHLQVSTAAVYCPCSWQIGILKVSLDWLVKNAMRWENIYNPEGEHLIFFTSPLTGLFFTVRCELPKNAAYKRATLQTLMWVPIRYHDTNCESD